MQDEEVDEEDDKEEVIDLTREDEVTEVINLTEDNIIDLMDDHEEAPMANGDILIMIDLKDMK